MMKLRLRVLPTRAPEFDDVHFIVAHTNNRSNPAAMSQYPAVLEYTEGRGDLAADWSLVEVVKEF